MIDYHLDLIFCVILIGFDVVYCYVYFLCDLYFYLLAGSGENIILTNEVQHGSYR